MEKDDLQTTVKARYIFSSLMGVKEILGVPVKIGALIGGIIALVFIITGNILSIFIMSPIFIIARVISKRDNYLLQIIFNSMFSPNELDV